MSLETHFLGPSQSHQPHITALPFRTFWGHSLGTQPLPGHFPDLAAGYSGPQVLPPSLPRRGDEDLLPWHSRPHKMTHARSLVPSPAPFPQLSPFPSLFPCSVVSPERPPALPSASNCPLQSCQGPPRSEGSLFLNQQVYLTPQPQILTVLFVCVPDKMGCPSQSAQPLLSDPGS